MNIKEASEITGVSATTIRYYEKEGLIPNIDRSEVGTREIDQRIIRRINFAKTMRAAGMSIEALKEYIELFDANENNNEQQLQILKDQLAIMEEKRDDLQFAIDHLKYKIEHNGHMQDVEDELRDLEKRHSDKKQS